MPFDFATLDQSVRLFGIMPCNVFPLEVLFYSYCTLNCSYCFSNKNREAHSRTPNLVNNTNAIMKKLNRLLDDELSPMGHFLRERYPLVFANSTDQFQRDEKKYRASETFLAWCQQRGQPLYIQTKGNVLYDEFERYKKYLVPGLHMVYCSITHADDRTRRTHEPGALSIPKRWELVRMLTDHGIPVVAAANPYVQEWLPSADDYCDLCVKHGAVGVVLDTLHLSKSQADEVPLFYKNSMVSKANRPAMFTLPLAERWQKAATERGLDFFLEAYWNGYFGDKSRHPECANPEWVGGRTLDFVFEIIQALRDTSAAFDNAPVLFSWKDIEAFLRWTDVSNPLLRTENFWEPYYSGSMKANKPCWKSRLGLTASFYEIMRYFWNHPWENQNLLWYHPRVSALFDLERNLYIHDDQEDKIAVFDPARPASAPFMFDHTNVDWDRSIWWDVDKLLAELFATSPAIEAEDAEMV